MKKKVILVFSIFLLMVLIGGTTYFIVQPKKPMEEDVTVPKEEETQEERLLREKIVFYHLEDYRNLISENKPLFDKYVEVVQNNTGIEKYQTYVMQLFPIIVNYKEYLDEDTFFKGLEKLTIDVNPDLTCSSPNAVGCYHANISIEIKKWDEESEDFSKDILVLYHELIHFLDYNINGNRMGERPMYFCQTKPHTFNQYYVLDEEEQKNCVRVPSIYLQFITEGGAEVWMARHFNHGITTTYPNYVQIYEQLNVLLGVDNMDRVFLGSGHTTELYDILVVKNNVSKETYDKFLEYLNKTNLTNENRVYFMDTCIEIYEKIHHQKWYEDSVFSYLVLNYLRDFIPLNYLYNSPNANAYKDYYYKTYLQINRDILKNIEDGKYISYSMPSLSYFNGTYNLDLYVEYKDNNEKKFGHLIVNYDFNNQSIIAYQFKPDPEIN